MFQDWRWQVDVSVRKGFHFYSAGTNMLPSDSRSETVLVWGLFVLLNSTDSWTGLKGTILFTCFLCVWGFIWRKTRFNTLPHASAGNQIRVIAVASQRPLLVQSWICNLFLLLEANSHKAFWILLTVSLFKKEKTCHYFNSCL